MEDRGVVFKAEGPNGWTVIGAGALVGVGLCIIALALWNLSMYAGVALIIVASGQAIGAVCVGASRIIEARGRARAMIGPNTREDIKRLWGGSDGGGYDFRGLTDADLQRMLAETEEMAAPEDADFCRAVRQELKRRWMTAEEARGEGESDGT